MFQIAYPSSSRGPIVKRILSGGRTEILPVSTRGIIRDEDKAKLEKCKCIIKPRGKHVMHSVHESLKPSVISVTNEEIMKQFPYFAHGTEIKLTDIIPRTLNPRAWSEISEGALSESYHLIPYGHHTRYNLHNAYEKYISAALAANLLVPLSSGSGTVRFMTWNVHMFSFEMKKVEVLLQYNADIIALQEVRDDNIRNLQAIMYKYGYSVFVECMPLGNNHYQE